MWSVGISVSPCEDATRIGYDARQMNRIVIRMAQFFLDRDMRVIFGHDWRDDGVMRAVADFAGVVAARAEAGDGGSDGGQSLSNADRTEPRMLNVVPTGRESLSRSAIEAQHDSGGVLKVIPFKEELKYMPEQMAGVREQYVGPHPQLGCAAELTALRKHITQLLDPGCRICLGGKTRGYLGNEPGVMEEAKLALEYRKPLYLMGGFGGAAREFGESEHHSATEYWRSRNGLRYDHKRELFETTDMECALRLISGGIGRFDPELDFLGVGLEA